MTSLQSSIVRFDAKARQILGAVFAAIFLLPLLSACGSNDLSRSDAQKMIETHEQVTQLKTNVSTFRESLQEAESQGVLFDEGLTSDAAGEIVSWDVRQGVIYLTNPAEIEVEITGITEPSGQNQNTRQANFNWIYKDLPPITKRFAANGGNGEASFILYDDGWRLERLLVRSNRERVQLTQSEIEAIEKGQKAASEKQAERRRYVEQSWTPTKVIDTISFPEYGRSVPQTIVVSDTDVKYLAATGATDTIWFGQITKINRSDRNERRVAVGATWLPGPNDRAVNDKIAVTIEGALAEWRKKYPDLSNSEVLSYNSRGK